MRVEIYTFVEKCHLKSINFYSKNPQIVRLIHRLVKNIRRKRKRNPQIWSPWLWKAVTFLQVIYGICTVGSVSNNLVLIRIQNAGNIRHNFKLCRQMNGVLEHPTGSKKSVRPKLRKYIVLHTYFFLLFPLYFYKWLRYICILPYGIFNFAHA